MLSAELGGADKKVKQWFFNLTEPALEAIFTRYGDEYGPGKRAYAIATYSSWKSGERRMSGEVASRLFDLLPKFMPADLRGEIAAELWHHFGPSHRAAIRIAADSTCDEAMRAIAAYMDAQVVEYKLPASLENRFNWLSGNDVAVRQNI